MVVDESYDFWYESDSCNRNLCNIVKFIRLHASFSVFWVHVFMKPRQLYNRHPRTSRIGGQPQTDFPWNLHSTLKFLETHTLLVSNLQYINVHGLLFKRWLLDLLKLKQHRMNLLRLRLRNYRKALIFDMGKFRICLHSSSCLFWAPFSICSEAQIKWIWVKNCPSCKTFPIDYFY